MGCSYSSVILAQVCSGRNPCFVKLYDCGIKRRNKLSQYTFDPEGFIIFSAENRFYFLSTCVFKAEGGLLVG